MKYSFVLKRAVFSASICKISRSENCETTGCDCGEKALIGERFITFITGTVGLKTEKISYCPIRCRKVQVKN
jgi:hypothetical protein